MSDQIKSERIEIVKTNDSASWRWEPAVGSETNNLLHHLNISDENKQAVSNEAIQILSRCIPPTSTPNTETGLVVGYVQSGKTMSFTTVATLARDNEYPMVIVIGGTTKPLFEQSVSRIRHDLRLDNRSDRKWQLFVNPKIRDRRVTAVRDTLMDWSDTTIPPEERQTVLIMVMKNHTHLNNLIRVLSGLGMDWSKVPTLVIDDEADQASLNTLVQDGTESTTYRCITGIRQVLPHHTFLQYTATPQGPLLINIINILSPDFAEVITPGPEYVGGKEFFIDSSHLVERIPPSEITTDETQEPPDSLRKAMAIFFLGITASRILGNPGKNRSMMVHPSMHRRRHTHFYGWVMMIKEHWQSTLLLPATDPDRIDLLEELKEAYDDLAQTVKDLPEFEKIIEHLPTTIRKTIVEEVNSSRGSTPIIDWSASHAYILVGGQAMDRGFTVEGLTVTYMPRSVGVGNADTVQQRARFFGYKRSYLGYCRIFLDQVTMQAYRDYIEHEEDIRRQLIEHSKTGKPLSEWKRAFLMPRQLRPTRKNVLDIDYIQDYFADDWFYPRSPQISSKGIQENKTVINNFLAPLKFQPDSGTPERTTIQRHLVSENVPLSVAHEQLLTLFRASSPNDSHKFIGLLLQIRNYLEQNPDDTCSVYLMSASSKDAWLTRERGLNAADEIANIFQGAHPDLRGAIYPGDRQVGDHGRLIIQIHKLDLTKDDKVVAKDVYDIAVWVPNKMAAGWLVQDQGESE